LKLTSEGLAEYQKALECLFAYINLMISQGPQMRNFDEVQKAQ
jgi:secreted Zn-dependent insulinase-like peptidase